MPNWNQQPNCSEQHLIYPQHGEAYGVTLHRKKPTFELNAGTSPTLVWTFRNPEGLPVDLTGCGFPASGSSVSLTSADSVADALTVWLRWREAIGDGSAGYCEVQGGVVDAANGVAHFQLEAGDLVEPGIYRGEAGVFGADAQLAFTNPCFLFINPGLFGSHPTGQLSVQEIRLHLRDNAPEDNELIDRIDFDASELAACIQRPVDYWNELPPPIGRHTTRSFPYRYMWLQGTLAQLYRLAAEHYRRNHYLTVAGGMQRDDKNKHLEYEQVAQARWQEFEKLARSKKAELNLKRGFGSLTSPYSGGCSGLTW